MLDMIVGRKTVEVYVEDEVKGACQTPPIVKLGEQCKGHVDKEDDIICESAASSYSTNGGGENDKAEGSSNLGLLYGFWYSINMTKSYVILKFKYKMEMMIRGESEVRLTQSTDSDDFADQFGQHEDDINYDQVDSFISTSGDDNEGEHGKEGRQLLVFSYLYMLIWHKF